LHKLKLGRESPGRAEKRNTRNLRGKGVFRGEDKIGKGHRGKNYKRIGIWEKQANPYPEFLSKGAAYWQQERKSAEVSNLGALFLGNWWTNHME